VTKIKMGLTQELRLGNLEARRDWGYAEDYVKAMWLMLQQDTPEDYAIATGETHTVRELVELAFSYADLDWKDYVIVDEKLYRPAEIYELRGDFSKARKQLGWTPTRTFQELIERMVDDEGTAMFGARHCAHCLPSSPPNLSWLPPVDNPCYPSRRIQGISPSHGIRRKG
jgi:GDPmannose 4,6-dehydratase